MNIDIESDPVVSSIENPFDKKKGLKSSPFGEIDNGRVNFQKPTRGHVFFFFEFQIERTGPFNELKQNKKATNFYLWFCVHRYWEDLVFLFFEITRSLQSAKPKITIELFESSIKQQTKNINLTFFGQTFVNEGSENRVPGKSVERHWGTTRQVKACCLFCVLTF